MLGAHPFWLHETSLLDNFFFLSLFLNNLTISIFFPVAILTIKDLLIKLRLSSYDTSFVIGLSQTRPVHFLNFRLHIYIRN